jgi:hypothetical protein
MYSNPARSSTTLPFFPSVARLACPYFIRGSLLYHADGKRTRSPRTSSFTLRYFVLHRLVCLPKLPALKHADSNGSARFHKQLGAELGPES